MSFSSRGAVTASKVLAFRELIVYRGQSDRKQTEEYIFINALKKIKQGQGAAERRGAALDTGLGSLAEKHRSEESTLLLTTVSLGHQEKV